MIWTSIIKRFLFFVYSDFLFGKMKGLVITSRGIEETAVVELRELLGAECKAEKAGEGCVIFDFAEFSQLCLLCYKSQSADRVLHLIGSFEFTDFFARLGQFIDELQLSQLPHGGLADKNKKFQVNFKVECLRLGSHDFNSVNAENKTAELLGKKLKCRNIDESSKARMKEREINCEIIFFVYIINNKCHFGVDFAGFELNKRGYKIFLASVSLRGTIAYALIRESGFKKKDVLLEPFSRDGVIPIEAAFYVNGFPPNYYKKDRFAFLKLGLGIDFERLFKRLDKGIKRGMADIYSYDSLFKHVDYCKKNAKIAGVDKQINFSRVELEWLDVKFKEGSVDRIVTNPPLPKNADLSKIYNEFFYQCSYILSKNGTVSMLSRMPDFVKSHAAKHDFSLLKERDVWSGEQLLKIMVFGK